MSEESPKTRLRWAVAEAALVLAGALLVAWLGARADVFTIDSYYYLTKAHSLSHGSWLTVPWGDGIDRKFFWGYSLALALPLGVLGEAAFWVVNALLYAWTGLVLARMLRMLPLSAPARLGAMALAVFNPVAIWWSTVPMSEALLVALAATAVFFGMRYRSGAAGREALWAALLGGLSFLTRVEGLFVALVLAVLCGPRILREGRKGLFALCVVIFVVPELVHVAYLKAFALESRGLIAYLDEARAHFHEFKFFDGLWRHLRAPFWMIFRFDTERWLYDRYFPGWLTVLQGIVTVLYASSLALALLSGLFPTRGFAFAIATGLLAFALLHSLWYYAYERYDYLTYPAAAVVFAWGMDTLVRWARPWIRTAVVLVLTLGCAAIAGAYGVRVSQMHADRLKLHQGGRDFRGIARVVNEANPQGRPVITDLGPHLAFYLNGFAYFSRSEADFYDDVVPAGEDGRVFLAQKKVAAIATSRPPRDVLRELALVEGEYHLVPAPGASVIVLDLPAAAAAD